MSAARTTFAITFVLFVGITLAVPRFPPAQLMYEYARLPQAALSIWGFSIATLLNGIINGFFWTIIAIAAYSLAQLTHGRTKEPVGAELDIETIRGIGPIRGALFRKLGIDTVSDLLSEGATERGRLRLASDVGVDSSTMLSWVYRGDLLRVRSIERMRGDKRGMMVKHDVHARAVKT